MCVVRSRDMDSRHRAVQNPLSRRGKCPSQAHADPATLQLEQRSGTERHASDWNQAMLCDGEAGALCIPFCAHIAYDKDIAAAVQRSEGTLRKV